MPVPSTLRLPNLGKISDQLASQNARISRYVDSLPRRVDSLVHAAIDSDWAEVRRLGDFLAATSEVYGCCEIRDAARRLCLEIDRPRNDLAVKRSLVRLIAKCGVARVPKAASASR